jgi:hypothetical protein
MSKKAETLRTYKSYVKHRPPPPPPKVYRSKAHEAYVKVQEQTNSILPQPITLEGRHILFHGALLMRRYATEGAAARAFFHLLSTGCWERKPPKLHR